MPIDEILMESLEYDTGMTADGIVTENGYEAACGNVITIDLGNGVTVKYGHLKEVNVSPGDEIRQGQVNISGCVMGCLIPMIHMGEACPWDMALMTSHSL